MLKAKSDETYGAVVDRNIEDRVVVLGRVSSVLTSALAVAGLERCIYLRLSNS